MSARDPHWQVLEHLTAELRAEPTPDLDWARLESRLGAPLVPKPRASARRTTRATWIGLSSLAAAAAVFLVMGLERRISHSEAPAANAPSALAAPDRFDGDQLSVGDWITSGEQQKVVEHAGRARWTLFPRSRARLIAKGERLTIALDSGGLLAEVVPTNRSESFRVEAKQTRIAVRGTTFRVELERDRVRVAVQRGSVVVGPAAGRDPTRGFVLIAPMAGTFSLDGAKTGQLDAAASPSTLLPRTPDSRAPKGSVARSSARPPAPRLEAAASSPVLSLPEAPASAGASASMPSDPVLPEVPVVPEVLIQKLVTHLSQCLANEMPERGDIAVSVTFDLSVEFAPDGALSQLDFDPPLPAAIERCSHDTVWALRAPVTERGLVLRQKVTLHR